MQSHRMSALTGVTLTLRYDALVLLALHLCSHDLFIAFSHSGSSKVVAVARYRTAGLARWGINHLCQMASALLLLE